MRATEVDEDAPGSGRRPRGWDGRRATERRAESTMHAIVDFEALRENDRITWTDGEPGWMAAPEEIVRALTSEGFQECKSETTTSRRDGRPAGGVWQGVDPQTGSVASAVWVTGLAWPRALVFIQVDGESLAGGRGLASRVPVFLGRDRDPYRDEGGEG